MQIIFFLSALAAISACNKEENNETGIHENQLVAKIDGIDTVFNIVQARLESFRGYKMLTINTSLCAKTIDLYLVAPEITAGEYPIHSAYTSGLPAKFSHAWFRILEPNSTNTFQEFYSEICSPEHKTIITKISGCTVKGSIRFLGTDQGLNSNNKKLIEGTFSTNLLVVE